MPIGLAIFLVLLTFHYHFTVPALDAFTLALFLVTSIQIILKFYRAGTAKKSKFLKGDYLLKLPGQNGILVKDIGPTQTGLVRLNDPLFEHQNIECIADQNIKAGEPVKVVEVDCGLLKIRKLNSIGT